MGFFTVGSNLRIRGGSVQLGADTNFYRAAANRLATDDAMQIGGTSNLVGASRVGGLLTAAGGINSSSGTPFVLPYATASPTINTNGQLQMLQKGNRSYLLYQMGGTPCHIMLPQTTDGTITVTVGGTP